MSRRNGMDDIDTWHEDKAICPYCKTIAEDDYDFLSGFDGLESDMVVTCGDCGKDFELNVELEPKYSTYKMELGLGSVSDTCLNCGKHKAAIREHHLNCCFVDYWGEVGPEWEHHEFVVTKERIAEWEAEERWLKQEMERLDYVTTAASNNSSHDKPSENAPKGEGEHL